MQPNVIDCYHGNTINDFAALKAAGVLGVIHKCTQGANIVDPMYATRRKLATDAGLLWGAYTFNTGQDVLAQVTEFFSHAEPDANTLMALDFEDNPQSQMSLNQAYSFLSQGDVKLGRKLVLYSGNRIKDLLGPKLNPFFGSHRLWLPQYGPVAKVQPSWKSQWLWQYSESGKLPGTDGAIDLNFYAGTSDQLKLEWA
jgi:GH25 family lysozyme M1 (1,4-beta-N-acetylmuramidase)